MAMLDTPQIMELIGVAHSLSIQALVEVHSKLELEMALEADADGTEAAEAETEAEGSGDEL